MTKTEIVKLQPPPALLEPCKLPKNPAPGTTADLITGFLEWRRSARECAASKDQLIEWYRVDTQEGHK